MTRLTKCLRAAPGHIQAEQRSTRTLSTCRLDPSHGRISAPISRSGRSISTSRPAIASRTRTIGIRTPAIGVRTRTFHSSGQSRRSRRLTFHWSGQSRRSRRLTFYSSGQSRRSRRLTFHSSGQSRRSRRLTFHSSGQSRRSRRLTFHSSGQSRRSRRLTFHSIGQSRGLRRPTFHSSGQYGRPRDAPREHERRDADRRSAEHEPDHEHIPQRTMVVEPRQIERVQAVIQPALRPVASDGAIAIDAGSIGAACASRSSALTLGKSQYIIPIADGNQSAKKTESGTPSHRWMTMSVRLMRAPIIPVRDLSTVFAAASADGCLAAGPPARRCRRSRRGRG